MVVVVEKIKSDCRVEIMRPGLGGGGEEGGPEGSGGASLCHISIMIKWRKREGFNAQIYPCQEDHYTRRHQSRHERKHYY